MIKNKKAAKYLTPWLFLVWGLIALSIAAAVIIIYSAKIDIKAEEADILAVRIADCLVDDGYLNEEVNQLNEKVKEMKINVVKNIKRKIE